MKKINFLIILVLLFLLTITLSFLGGIFYTQYNQNVQKQLVTSTTIVDKISNEAFFISKTAYLDQDIEIVVDTGSDWSNFWWGQTITAESLIKVNIGVDLKTLTAEDIVVDKMNNRITITLPAASVLDALPIGDISVTNTEGLLKMIFQSDTNKDYNLAYQKLQSEAINAINTRPELFSDAEADAGNLLKLILNDTGYGVNIISSTGQSL